jgi:hypothetical protein
MQHPTIQGYAEWVFGTFRGPRGEKLDTSQSKPFSEFQTMDEVGAAYTRAWNQARDNMANRAAMKTDGPI